MEHLFVYGSLRSEAGHEMSAVLAAGAVRVGVGTARGRLYAVDWYPGLVLDERAGEVRGELWRIHDAMLLERLDGYEGCGPDDAPPHEFRRVATAVRLRSGQRIDAWVYVYTRAVHEAQRVDSGDWCDRTVTPI